MDRGTWWTTVHEVAKSQTVLRHFHFLYPFDEEKQSQNIVTEFRRILIASKRQKFGLLTLVLAKTCHTLEKGSK